MKIAYSRWGMVCMAVICDGLGGLAQGEVASGNVILAFDKWFKEEFLKSDKEWTEERIKNAWESIVYMTNAKIKDYGQRCRIELGTTLTAVLFLGNSYYAVHVGDCRLYEIQQSCKKITRDQTLVASEVEYGIISEEEAQNDSRRNVLLQCIGVTSNLMPDFIYGRTTPNASYLLCSDGFRHVVSEQEIQMYCNPENNTREHVIQANLQSMIELNKQRGETDNISAILVRVGNIR